MLGRYLRALDSSRVLCALRGHPCHWVKERVSSQRAASLRGQQCRRPPQTRSQATMAGGAATMAPVVTRAHIPGLLRWVESCNNGAAAAAAGEFLPLTVEGSVVGCLKPDFVEHLRQFPDVFELSAGGAALSPALASPEARTAAVGAALATLRGQGLIEGWRDELYPAVRSFHDAPAFLLERAAAPHFGIKAYGVHVNGYVELEDGSTELWVARRSKSKPTWPGRLDHIVAGGQPHGLSARANVVKECWEEAGIPPGLAARATPVGAVSYTSLQAAGLKRDVLLCFDLRLPPDFVPVPQDGEVEEFMRLPLAAVADLVAGVNGASEEFKDNCNLVIVDFLLRRGHLDPDTPGYLEVLAGLRSGDLS